jgi:hypothetical protein
MNPIDKTFIELKYGTLEDLSREELKEFLTALPDQVLTNIYLALFKNKYHTDRAGKIAWIMVPYGSELHLPSIKCALLEYNNK